MCGVWDACRLSKWSPVHSQENVPGAQADGSAVLAETTEPVGKSEVKPGPEALAEKKGPIQTLSEYVLLLKIVSVAVVVVVIRR